MPLNKYPHLTKAFKDVIVIQKGNYPYPISPFAGVTAIKSEMIKEVAEASLREKNLIGKKYQDTLDKINIPLRTIIKIQVVDNKVVIID